jgi:hypothetical protein
MTSPTHPTLTTRLALSTRRSSPRVRGQGLGRGFAGHLFGGLSRKEETEPGEPVDDGDAARLVIGYGASQGRGTARAMASDVDALGEQVPRLRAAAYEAHLKRAVERDLHVAFPSVPLDQVTVLVECLWSHVDAASIRDFVPLLVRRQAQEELIDHLDVREDAVLSSSGASAHRTFVVALLAPRGLHSLSRLSGRKYFVRRRLRMTPLGCLRQYVSPG